MLCQQVFDLLGIDVLPSSDDDVFLASHQLKSSRFIKSPEIPQSESAILPASPGGLRVMIIAPNAMRSADGYESDLPAWDLSPRFINQSDFVARERSPHCPKPCFRRII